MRELLVQTTRAVAKALDDDGVRNQLYAALQGSPFREHKLHFGRLLRAGGRGLLARMSPQLGGNDAATLATVDSMFELEFYMPVPAHRAAWTGGRNLIVASQFADRDSVVGFDLSGTRVALSPDAPPPTPVLSLVSRETDFDAAPSGSPMLQTCNPTEENNYCSGGGGGGDGGGGGGGGCSVTYSTPGIYMTYSNLVDLHEGWPRGSPEIQAILIGQTMASHPDSVAQAGVPAGEHGIGARYFDQDDHTWSAGACMPGVLVASDAEIEQVHTAYAYSIDTVAITVSIWEDDDNQDYIVDGYRWYDAVLNTGGVIAGMWIGKITTFDTTQSQFVRVLGAVPLVGAVAFGLNAMQRSIFRTITGANDDFIGIAVPCTSIHASTFLSCPNTHGTMDGTTKTGDLQLIYRP